MQRFFKSFILVSAFLCLSHLSKATHIVGGEFELVHLDDFLYRLNLVQFFDVVNGNPFAEDPFVVAFIFRSRDDQFMQSVNLNLADRNLVEYTQPECAIAQLVTRRLFYTTLLELPPEIYNDPEGYYVVFERCCRNNVISNIFLSAPNTVGQTFFMRFPPVVKDDEPFVNSSPNDLPVVSDFACVNQLFYFDISTTDADGDSLAYSLINPLNSSSTVALPTPTPQPHPPVPWVAGISTENMIPGTPPLNITNQGLLTVKPSQPGLYAFAIKIDEFRGGEKIGEVRRDFQILVLDCGIPQFAPQISATLGESGDLLWDNDFVRFGAEEEKCLEFVISDPNSGETVDGEFISIEAVPINFEADLEELFSPSSNGIINASNDSLTFEICLPDCPLVAGEPFQIEFRASDQTCPQPLMDTLTLSIFVEAPENEDPFFVNTPKQISDTVVEGDTFVLPLEGVDNDNDLLSITAIADGNMIENFETDISILESLPGSITGEFIWNTACGVNAFQEEGIVNFQFLLEDDDACKASNADVLSLDLYVDLPDNTDPVVLAALPEMSNGNNEIDLEVDFSEPVNFNVLARDEDGDFINLFAISEGFDLEELGIQFEPVGGVGEVNSEFLWEFICEEINLLVRDEFPVSFIATDEDLCLLSNADTLTVNFRIVPEPNQPPVISSSPSADGKILASAGSTFRVELSGIDADNDSLQIRIIDLPSQIDLQDFIFEAVPGEGEASAVFEWSIDCELSEDTLSSDFTLAFAVFDNYCAFPQSDSIVLQVGLSEESQIFAELNPPNVFTPNGDNINDEYFIPNLPFGDCGSQFESVEIYNRWGRVVFEDTRADFRWDGKDASPGLYYYFIRYTDDRVLKGFISLIL